MRKLNRLNIDALKKANPILGSIEQRLIIGGVGPGDCVFRCIGYLVGTDQDAVRNTYARYLMVNSGIVPGACGGDGYLFINDNGTYTNSGGDKQIKIHSMYKYKHK